MKNSNNMSKITQFQPGNTYEMRFIGDSDLKVPVKVVRRTAKFLHVIERPDRNTEIKRIGVKVYDGVEYAYPSGRYSMAPSIRADKTIGFVKFQKTVKVW